MALFPVIESPCPVRSQLANWMDGDVCRMCERQVFDLTAMSGEERIAFVAGCSGDVCVSYGVPLKGAMAALAVSLLMPTAAAAQDAPVATDAEYEDQMEIIVGGIRPTAKFVAIETDADRAIPELPVVVEAKPEPRPTAS